MQEHTDQAFDLEVHVLKPRPCWALVGLMHPPNSKAKGHASMNELLHMQAYAANYVSHGKVNRLLFIASKSNDTGIQLDALRLAADEVAPVSHLLLLLLSPLGNFFVHA